MHVACWSVTYFALLVPTCNYISNWLVKHVYQVIISLYILYLLEMMPWHLLISQLLEGGDNSSYEGSEAREVFIDTFSDISGVNK